MQNIIHELTQLTAAIAQDRSVNTSSKDVLLAANLVGEGFIDGQEPDDDEVDDNSK